MDAAVRRALVASFVVAPSRSSGQESGLWITVPDARSSSMRAITNCPEAE